MNEKEKMERRKMLNEEERTHMMILFTKAIISFLDEIEEPVIKMISFIFIISFTSLIIASFALLALSLYLASLYL